MSELGDLLRELRGKRSLREIAALTELSHTYISDVEKGYRRGTKKPLNPSPDTLKRLAKAYDYPYEELLKAAGYVNTSYAIPEVAKTLSKEERDIAKQLIEFTQNIENSDALAFDGEPMSKEAKESLIESMEHIFRQTQRINKKYTPKKYLDDE